MSRPVYRLDTANIAYDRVPDMELTFDFVASANEARVLRTPRAVVVGSQTTFRVHDLKRRPGPPVNGMQPYRMTLERIH